MPQYYPRILSELHELFEENEWTTFKNDLHWITKCQTLASRDVNRFIALQIERPIISDLKYDDIYYKMMQQILEFMPFRYSSGFYHYARLNILLDNWRYGFHNISGVLYLLHHPTLISNWMVANRIQVFNNFVMIIEKNKKNCTVIYRLFELRINEFNKSYLGGVMEISVLDPNNQAKVFFSKDTVYLVQGAKVKAFEYIHNVDSANVIYQSELTGSGTFKDTNNDDPIKSQFDICCVGDYVVSCITKSSRLLQDSPMALLTIHEIITSMKQTTYVVHELFRHFENLLSIKLFTSDTDKNQVIIHFCYGSNQDSDVHNHAIYILHTDTIAVKSIAFIDNCQIGKIRFRDGKIVVLVRKKQEGSTPVEELRLFSIFKGSMAPLSTFTFNHAIVDDSINIHGNRVGVVLENKEIHILSLITQEAEEIVLTNLSYKELAQFQMLDGDMLVYIGCDPSNKRMTALFIQKYGMPPLLCVRNCFYIYPTNNMSKLFVLCVDINIKGSKKVLEKEIHCNRYALKVMRFY